MPNVHFELTGDEQKFVQSMLRSKRATEGSKEEAKKLAAELRGIAKRFDEVDSKGRQANQAVGGGFKRMEAGVAGLSAGILSLTGVVATAHKAVSIFLEDTAKKAKVALEVVGEMISAISGAGDLGDITATRTALLKAEAPGLAVQQRVDLYKAIRGEAPTAPLPEVMKMFQQAARGAQMGMGDQDIQQFGQTIAALSKVGVGGSAEETANLAKLATEAFGKRGAQFLTSGVGALGKYRAAGGDPMEGLAVMLSMMEAGLPPEQLGSLIEQAAGVKAVTPRQEVPGPAKARLADIAKERALIETRREEIRRVTWEREQASERRAAEEETLPRPAAERSRREREAGLEAFRAEREAELEGMRRREFDLLREQERLQKERAPVALTPDEALRTRLAGLPFSERMQTLLQEPEAAQALGPAFQMRTALALRAFGMPGPGYQEMRKKLEAGRFNYIEKLIGKTMADPAARSIFEARRATGIEEVEGELRKGQQIRDWEVRTRQAAAAAERAGAGPLRKEAARSTVETVGYLVQAGVMQETPMPAGVHLPTPPAHVIVDNLPRRSPLGGGQEVRNRGNE